LRTLRASVAAVADYSLSGVWRLLQRLPACSASPRAAPPRVQRLPARRRPLRDHLSSPAPD